MPDVKGTRAVMQQLPRFWYVFAGCYAALIIIGPVAGTLLYLAAAVWALRGPFAIVQALTISWLVTLINPGIVALVPGAEFLKTLVILVAFVQALIHLFSNPAQADPRACAWLTVYCVVIAVSSALTSYAVDVSLFKIANFYAGALSIVVSSRVATRRGAPIKAWYFALFLTTIVISLPLFASSLGYFVNGSGFQGILNHPQSYGIFVTIAVAWLFSEVWFGKRRDPYVLTGLGVGLISLFSTGSRTGVVATAAALGVTFIVRVVRRGEFNRWGGAMALGLTVLVAAMLIPGVRTAAMNFLSKGDASRYENLNEAFQSSRGELLQLSMLSFVEHPLFGIGFGIARDPQEMFILRDPYMGLPISAPVEKGFAGTASLEETGAVGTGLLIVFLCVLLSPAAKEVEPTFLVASLGALFTNFGESTLFSFGGMGLLVWLTMSAFSSGRTTPAPPRKSSD